MPEEITVNGPLATYKGVLRGFDPVVGPKGAAVVYVSELVEITETVPKWAVHPKEKVGRRSRFDPEAL